MINKKQKWIAILAVSCAAVIAAGGCGKNEPQRLSSEAVQTESAKAAANDTKTTKNTESKAENAAGTESDGQQADSDGQPAKQNASSEADKQAESKPAETYDSSGSYAGTIAAEGVNEAGSPYFGVMHARVLGAQTDEQEGTTTYTLQDLSDPDNAWSISDTDIGSIDADLTKGNTVAVFFHGDIVSDSENVHFIAIAPDGNYEIKRIEGVTTSNVMSTFRLQEANGSEISFLKDNCEMEEGAMQNDSGDHIVVYYAAGDGDMNYPLKIYGTN